MLSPIFSPDFPQVSVVPGGTVRLLSEVHDVVQVQSTLQICPGIGSRRRVALTSQAGEGVADRKLWPKTYGLPSQDL